jgi:type I restriction enzyme S subunit
VVRQVKDKVDPLKSGLDRYVAGEHMDTDDLRLRRWGQINGNYLGPAFHMRFKPGHVLYGSRRTYLRKVAVADFEGICANTTFVLESKDSTVLLPELLPFIMQTEAFHDHSIKQSKGSVNPYVNFSDLAWYEFALPPLEEQRRIAEVLTAQSAVEQGQLELASLAETVARAYADAVFDISAVKSVFAKQASVSDLDLTPLGDLCSVQVGFPFSSSKYTTKGDRLLRCSNVGVKHLNWAEDITKYWPAHQRDQYKDYVLRSGDIVIALDRPFVASGFKVAQVKAIDLPALLLQRVGRFILGPKVRSEFMWCFLQSSSFRLQLMSQQQGTDLPHISKYDIEDTYLPRYSLREQENIGVLFQALEDAMNQAARRLEATSQIKHRTLNGLLKT